MVEWIVSIVLAITSGVVLFLEGWVFIFFLIPAIVCSPIVLDFIYSKGLLISNTLKWVIIFVFCIIGTILIVNKEVETIDDIEIVNPMDGLVLNEQKILRMDEDGDINEGIDLDTLGEDGNGINDENSKSFITEEKIRQELSYTVLYFYDDKQSDAATETIVAHEGDEIKYEDIKDKTLGLYELDYMENLPLTLSANGNNVIKIYYTRQQKEVSYTIKYYYNGSLDSSKTEYLTGKTGTVIRDYPKKPTDGLVPLKAINFPLKLSFDEKDNEIRIYYGFDKNTTMEELGLVEGFAPTVILRKKTTASGEEVEQIECPLCGSIFDKDSVEIVDDETTCPICEETISLIKRDENGEEIIDNPKQQQISEKYALNLQTREIHNPLCYYVRKIPEEFFKASNDSIDDLENQGFHICKKCNPK